MMDHAHEDRTDRELLESTSAASEAEGEFWKIYAHREQGKSDRRLLVVTVAPRVRRKMRIPRKYETPELRARFARGAADEIRREYLQAHETPMAVACDDAVESQLTLEKVANLWTSGELARFDVLARA